MTCPYTGCDARRGECSGACMVKLDPKDLDAARMVLRAEKKPWSEVIEFADEDPEPIGLITKAVIAVFVVVIVAAALLPVLVR